VILPASSAVVALSRPQEPEAQGERRRSAGMPLRAPISLPVWAHGASHSRIDPEVVDAA